MRKTNAEKAESPQYIELVGGPRDGQQIPVTKLGLPPSICLVGLSVPTTVAWKELIQSPDLHREIVYDQSKESPNVYFYRARPSSPT